MIDVLVIIGIVIAYGIIGLILGVFVFGVISDDEKPKDHKINLVADKFGTATLCLWPILIVASPFIALYIGGRSLWDGVKLLREKK